MSIWHIFVLAILACIYLAPAIIAFRRRHANRVAIAALDILAGWSLIGWIAAFVWALTNKSIHA